MFVVIFWKIGSRAHGFFLVTLRKPSFVTTYKNYVPYILVELLVQLVSYACTRGSGLETGVNFFFVSSGFTDGQTVLEHSSRAGRKIIILWNHAFLLLRELPRSNFRRYSM